MENTNYKRVIENRYIESIKRQKRDEYIDQMLDEEMNENKPQAIKLTKAIVKDYIS